MREERKESYGVIQFNNVSHSSDKVLFGSKVQTNKTISLTIKKGYRDETFDVDHYYGLAVVTEIEMTRSQFAELITSFNTGEGVPCTLVRTQELGYIEHENCETFTERTEKIVNDKAVQIEDKLKELSNAINDSISNKKISKTLGDSFLRMVREISSLSVGSFYKDQMMRNIEQAFTEAKAELAVNYDVNTNKLIDNNEVKE